MAEEAEEQPEQEQIARMARSFQEVIEAAKVSGLVYVEAFICVKCGTFNFFTHMGLESLSCIKCDHRYASTAPRGRQPGDVLVEHHLLAARMLRTIYEEQQKGVLPPIPDPELHALPAEMRLLLARHWIAQGRETVIKLGRIAEELAAIDGSKR